MKLVYEKLSSRFSVRAIVSIIGFGISVLIYILFDLFRFFDLYIDIEFQTVFGVLNWSIIVVDIIFAFLIIDAVKILKSEAQHIHFTQFHSKFLVGVIISSFQFVYMMIVPMLYSLFHSPIVWPTFYLSIQLIYAVGFAISFIANVIAMNAWAHFLRYAKLNHLSPKLTQNIAMIKNGNLFLAIGSIIETLAVIFTIIMFEGFSYGIFMEILSWIIYIASVLFMIIPPTLLIIGRYRIAKTLKATRVTSSIEPTLDENLGGQTQTQFRTDMKFCKNCGDSMHNDAHFCPNCGSSI